MDVQQAYNSWASQYDSNENKTRDLEAIALRKTLANIQFENCLEIGCGTGKNTDWLITKSTQIIAVDFSDEMISKAKQKIISGKIRFIQADIKDKWNFGNKLFDLVTFSLVLEHIENLDHIFNEASNALRDDGHIYIGELHPFKQYAGSKARFETENGTQVVECFNHHISDFISAAKIYGFAIINIEEFFDDNNRNGIPRVLTLLFQKKMQLEF